MRSLLHLKLRRCPVNHNVHVMCNASGHPMVWYFIFVCNIKALYPNVQHKDTLHLCPTLEVHSLMFITSILHPIDKPKGTITECTAQEQFTLMSNNRELHPNLPQEGTFA